MRSSIKLLTGIALVVGLAACGGDNGGAGGELDVVVTTTQLGSVTAEVGGDDVDLTVLLQAGSEAHDYEMTPADAAAIEDADLVLRSGAGLEGWLDDALETIGGTEVTRDMSRGVALQEPIGPEHGAHDESEDEHDAHDESEDEHGSATDPHYWLNAPNAIQMVTNVADALAEADATNADAYRQRAAVLIGRLEAADTEIRRLMAEIPEERRGIVTNHDALGYFIEAYGLRFVGSIFPSLDVAAEPSAGELAELIDTIRAEGVVAVFSESAVNPDLAQAVAAETGAEFVSRPLYADSLGPEGSGAETLDGMLLHNASVIHDALAPG